MIFPPTPYKDACLQQLRKPTCKGIHADYYPRDGETPKPSSVCSRHGTYPCGECSGAHPVHHRPAGCLLHDADLRCGVLCGGCGLHRLQGSGLPLLGIDDADNFFIIVNSYANYIFISVEYLPTRSLFFNFGIASF